jgi:hypothetical protein
MGYIRLSNLYPNLVNFRSNLLLKVLKSINCQLQITFQQDCFKQEVKHYVLRSINSIILSGFVFLPLWNKIMKLTNSNYRGILSIETLLRIVLRTIFSSLNKIVEEITEDHQCGFQVTDQLHIKYSRFVRY